MAVTYSAAVSTPSSNVSTETPSHLVPSFDHLVTQWMSFVISSEGSCLISSQVHLLGSSISPAMEKSHSSSGVRGVGPAERTGKPSTKYCPGGSAVSWLLRRPLKPREKNPSLIFYASSVFRLYSSVFISRGARLIGQTRGRVATGGGRPASPWPQTRPGLRRPGRAALAQPLRPQRRWRPDRTSKRRGPPAGALADCPGVARCRTAASAASRAERIPRPGSSVQGSRWPRGSRSGEEGDLRG